MNLDLSGKNAMVCGSTQGIGRAIAEELALLGASVTLVARSEEKLRQIQTKLPKPAGQEHHFLCADFSKPEELKDKLSLHLQDGKAYHILVNNTGGPAAGPISGANTTEFLSAFNNHLICNHILAQALLPGMKNAQFGRIINIISTSVKQPLKGLGVSNTIRAAVANWSKTLATEVASFGITVNNVLPGATKTARLESIISNKATKTGHQVNEVEIEMLTEIPAGRFATAEEIAAAAAFLATPAAAYITGINVPVDGGRTSCL
ncbi:MAG: SDR family oxidoreductase [Chitinophagaceae bacterium]|nr:MAG: SDR family oxidoreductase [Chitinophagaceae bacterium]